MQKSNKLGLIDKSGLGVNAALPAIPLAPETASHHILRHVGADAIGNRIDTVLNPGLRLRHIPRNMSVFPDAGFAGKALDHISVRTAIPEAGFTHFTMDTPVSWGISLRDGFAKSDAVNWLRDHAPNTWASSNTQIGELNRNGWDFFITRSISGGRGRFEGTIYGEMNVDTSLFNQDAMVYLEARNLADSIDPGTWSRLKGDADGFGRMYGNDKMVTGMNPIQKVFIAFQVIVECAILAAKLIKSETVAEKCASVAHFGVGISAIALSYASAVSTANAVALQNGLTFAAQLGNILGISTSVASLGITLLITGAAFLLHKVIDWAVESYAKNALKTKRLVMDLFTPLASTLTTTLTTNLTSPLSMSLVSDIY
ncbi:hypothetical protein HK098_007982 [Nowakowskiella sp. JEL0407]|nr:hypothetical protein HK098_007982 [Nowakowskiella sp. JEL0407]